MKRIATVLDSEDAEEKAVHAEYHCTPYENGDLLLPRIDHARHSECERNCCERKCTICMASVIQGAITAVALTYTLLR